jgi:hypothetical protein
MLIAYVVATDEPAPAWGLSRLPDIALHVVLLWIVTMVLVAVYQRFKRPSSPK